IGARYSQLTRCERAAHWRFERATRRGGPARKRSHEDSGRTPRSPQEGGEPTRTASIDGDDGRRRRGTPAFSDRRECGGDVVNPRAPNPEAADGKRESGHAGIHESPSSAAREARVDRDTDLSQALGNAAHRGISYACRDRATRLDPSRAQEVSLPASPLQRGQRVRLQLGELQELHQVVFGLGPRPDL
ncbi:hypothetical protein T12_7483, partial [Trichinella patagoniensis]